MWTPPKTLARKIALYSLSFFFVSAGISHFVVPEFFTAIMPPYLPLHLELVYLSGLFEIGLGLALLPVATRSRAGVGLIALLMAVFPANIQMAIHPQEFVAGGTPIAAIYGRLPVQFLFMYWAWWATRPEHRANP